MVRNPRVTLYILIFIIFANVNKSLLDNCFQEKKCQCNVPEDKAIFYCTHIMYYLSKKTIQLTCNRNYRFIYNVPYTVLEKKSTMKCEFDFSTKNIFNQVGFEHPVSLVMTTKDNHDIEWDGSYFTGLEKIEKLVMKNFTVNSKTPNNLLERMANLRDLVIQSDVILEDTFCKYLPTKLSSLSWTVSTSALLLKNSFQSIKELKNLEIEFSKSIDIDVDIFSDLKKLRVLKLYSLDTSPSLNVKNGNATYNLCDNTNSQDAQFQLFEGAKNIEHIELTRCGLAFIPNKIFVTKRLKVKILMLSYNSISEILPYFSKYQTLLQLHLNNNKIKFISRSAFNALTHLESLFLQENQISAYYPMHRSLFKFNISHNNLKSLTIPRCNFYMDVDLSYNNISDTKIYETFKDCQLRLILNLSNNKLRKLQVDTLTFQASSVILDLRHNLIEEIALNNTKKLENNADKWNIIIDNNPIKCQCEIFNFVKCIQTLKYRKIFQMEELACVSPLQLKERTVKDIKLDEILCYTNTSSLNNVECPEHCTCYSQPSLKYFTVNCSNIGLTALPAHLPKPNSSFETHLYLNNNNLTSMYKAGPDYEDIVSIHLDNNNISAVLWLPHKLKVLKLNNNSLVYLNESITDQLLSNTSTLRSVALNDNPWKCFCENKYLLLFLKQNIQKVEDISKIKCNGETILNDLMEADLCPKNIVVLIVPIILITQIIIIAIIYMCYKYNIEIKVWLYAHRFCLWYFPEEELDRDKEYDAFVSYSHEDEAFVAFELVPELEQGENPFKLCVHHRDWLGGDRIAAQIARSVQNSRRTLIVLSPAFLKSIWGKMELQTAHLASLKEKRPKVVVILLKEIGPNEDLGSELRAYLTMNTYIDRKDQLFWQKLRYALPHPPRLTRSERNTVRRIEIEMSTSNRPTSSNS